MARRSSDRRLANPKAPGEVGMGVAPFAGALELWRRELAAGARTRRVMDTLWRAACREAMAIDFDRLGLHRVAENLRREAAAIIVVAARPRRTVR